MVDGEQSLSDEPTNRPHFPARSDNCPVVGRAEAGVKVAKRRAQRGETLTRVSTPLHSRVGASRHVGAFVVASDLARPYLCVGLERLHFFKAFHAAISSLSTKESIAPPS